MDFSRDVTASLAGLSSSRITHWMCCDVNLCEGRHRFDKASSTSHELFGLFGVSQMNVRKYPRQPIFCRFSP